MISPLPRTVALVSLALVAAGCTVPRPTHPAEGRVMGSVPIASLDDAALPVPSLAGKVTLLNFWGTWCPPCRKELPGLVRTAERLAGEPRFQLVAVSCGAGTDDAADLARDTRQFLSARQLAIPAWGFADPLAMSLFASAYGLEAFPTTYLIGPDRRVRRVWTGYRGSDEADIAASIVALLRELPPAPDATAPDLVTPAARP